MKKNEEKKKEGRGELRKKKKKKSKSLADQHKLDARIRNFGRRAPSTSSDWIVPLFWWGCRWGISTAS
jgi:hypothetical protein